MFERELSKFTGAPHVALTDSCSNAIFLSLEYLRRYRKFDGEVSIPQRTYVSVPQAILNAGFEVSFRDERWLGTYQLKGTPIIDAAVCFASQMYEPKTMMCISFQQKKALPIGKGGAVLLDDYHAYKTIKRMAWDGRDASKPVAEDLVNIIPGYHMNMIPDDAAKGVLLLNQFDGKVAGSFMDYPNISGLGGNK